MTVSAPVRLEKLGVLIKDFHGVTSVWKFFASSDEKRFYAVGGTQRRQIDCKSREELRHLWAMMTRKYHYTQV